jgi:hypothetical protein
MSKRPPVTHQPAADASESLPAATETAEAVAGLTAAQRRFWLLAFRSGQRSQRRREVRSEIRAAYWAHRSGLGPRPPIQAVRASGRYLSEFVWDSERRCWRCPQAPLVKSPEQERLELAA